MNLYRVITSRAGMSAQLGMVCAFTLAACGGGSSSGAPPAAAMGFTDTALVTDNDTVVATALTIDANLQNPWGIAFAPGSPF